MVLDRLIEKEWKTRATAADWARRQADEFEAVLAPEREERAQLAARLALTDGILDKAMNMTGRLRRDFIRLLERFAAEQR